ncbi:hypothetical protein DERP_010711 [Dermatophagoides pteronyssinus]|uniref:Uncharacterized protein n=1 Tax=Dermatophagoides pteronyssinus TaxID=6956 RepID=A0ABQ8J6I5_DERPT|nr:hypothetical protein DERP_010711 [Dermatophagoides pteronyssinus]
MQKISISTKPTNNQNRKIFNLSIDSGVFIFDITSSMYNEWKHLLFSRANASAVACCKSLIDNNGRVLAQS